MNDLSLQERYAAASVCYGCGPANERGFHIRSSPSADNPDEFLRDVDGKALHWLH